MKSNETNEKSMVSYILEWREYIKLMRNARICNPLYSFEAHPLSHHGTIYTMDYGIKLTLTVLGKKVKLTQIEILLFQMCRESPLGVYFIRNLTCHFQLLHLEHKVEWSSPFFSFQGI